MASMNKIGKTATTVMATKGMLSVVYHSTEVVNVSKDNIVTLDTGGWKTVTTKARMNQAANQFGLGYQVNQTGYKWLVRLVGEDGDWSNARVIPFDDYSVSFEVTR